MIPQRAGQRVPPHDFEAEASVLGAFLLDADAVTRVVDLLEPEDFYREHHGQIYRAARNLMRDGEPIDNVTLAFELEKMGVLEQVGGRAYLAMLQEQTPTAGNVREYARIVKDRARKRVLIAMAGRIADLGYDEALSGEDAAAAAERDWEAARPSALALVARESRSKGELVPIAPFPLDALPRQLRDFALAAHESFGYPPEFIAVPGLSALAVAVGGANVLQVMSGWISRPIVWTVVIAPPGSAKSPAQDLVLSPLIALEAEWADAYRERWEEHQAQMAGLGKGEIAPPTPIRRRCRASDTNIAALTKILIENPDRGLAWVSNEISSIVGSLDQYRPGGRGGDRPRFIELWDGTDLPLDRIERGSALIRRPLVSVVGGLQPELLSVLAGGDGLGPRFLRTFHPNAGMALARPDRGLPGEVIAAWDRLIRDLVSRQPDEQTMPRLLVMEPAAQALWVAFQEELQGLYASDHTSSFGQQVIAKGPNQLARLALVLHCAAHAHGAIPQMVGPESVVAAADLVRYFVHQALTCEPDEPSPAADRHTRDLDVAVTKLIRWIQRRPQPWATNRDIRQAKTAGLKTEEEVSRVLARYGEIHPGCVVDGRAPGAKTGPVGKVVYLPGHAASDDATRRMGEGSAGPAKTVGIVGTVGGGAPENGSSGDVSAAQRTQRRTRKSCRGDVGGGAAPNSSNNSNSFSDTPADPADHDAAGPEDGGSGGAG